MFDFYGWGLSIGYIAGIHIRVHWLLLLFWAYKLQSVMSAPDDVSRGWLAAGWAIGTLISFASILLHELGHCFAARRVGGDAPEVLMWPLGGLAFCTCPDYWRAHLIVAAGGPAVTAVIAGLGYLGFELLPWLWRPESLAARYLLSDAEYMVVEWNLFILVFNLIPLYPMDGGRIFHALAWAYHARRGGYAWGGQALASRLTLQVSRVTAACGLVYAVYTKDLWIGMLFLWAWNSAERLREDGW